ITDDAEGVVDPVTGAPVDRVDSDRWTVIVRGPATGRPAPSSANGRPVNGSISALPPRPTSIGLPNRSTIGLTVARPAAPRPPDPVLVPPLTGLPARSRIGDCGRTIVSPRVITGCPVAGSRIRPTCGRIAWIRSCN